MPRTTKRLIIGTASIVALMGACSIAVAQETAPDAAPDTANEDTSVVVVTGSRITTRGFTQPTPTQSLTVEELEKSAKPNIFNAIAELPSLQGSTGRQTSVSSTSSGIQGLSSFSMRGLGPLRTLTLLDGQRVVAANVSGVTDISMFPQLLIKRVDVVTGGASASYGSDAIGGVVNFVTDTRFKGFKANVEAGVTNYDDDKNYVVQAAWGDSFLNDRLHVQVSGEQGHDDGIPTNRFGAGPGPNGRDWFVAPAFQVRPIAQTNDGKPQMYYIEQAQQFQYAKHGLITSGPLQGTAFGPNGQPFQFQYGSNGVPTGTGAVTNCITPFCVGGDLSGNVANGTTLAMPLDRTVAYTRIGYDLDDNNEIYFTANAARVASINTPNPGAAKNANLTIQCDNVFLPQSIKTACANNNITSFQFGTSNANFPRDINVHPTRKSLRFVVGADGRFEFGGTEWTYNAYAEHGESTTDLYVHDITLTPRYNAAIDAIAGPGGIPICRSIIAQASGCQPLNIIGDVKPSDGALAYVLPANGPQAHWRQTQDLFSVNVSGAPFSSWAGPVSIATGVEFRREWYRVTADPYGNGINNGATNSPEYPADPLMNTVTGNNWYAGNYHNGNGSYSVGEGYVEFNVPVLDSPTLGTANINIAGRKTTYSTAGDVDTWKIGGSWKTGIDGLRLRAVTSRDARAPNLSELFSAPVIRNNIVNYNGGSITVLEQTLGNPNLRPEIARSSEIGIVLSQPTWAPAFSVSLDYYDIKVDDVISTLSGQQEVDLCVAGNQELCAAMLLTSTVPNTNFIKLQAFNLASLHTKGFDIEAAYRTDLKRIGLPGKLTVRALATHTISFLTDPGIVGTIPSEGAGNNTGSTPDWKYLINQTWEVGKLSLTLTERGFSDGVFSNEFIECQTGCPVATVQHPTINYNQMKGATYIDFGGTYDISEKVTAYFKIDNLTDKSPTPLPQTNGLSYANPMLYDMLGRMYRVGMRFNF